MRLNQFPADQGAQPDLASSPAEMRAAARAIDQHILGDTRKAGSLPDKDTEAVVKEFGAKDGHGWLTSRAVQKAHNAWGEQVKAHTDRLSSDRDSLKGANQVLHGTDTVIGVKTGQVSVFHSY
ncbi:hypothetical protein AB0942_15725 [Streptomyces nodosus]|uniref:hypothetical protein n=1 Tax=Streptomyces nodosus TaxID=40318 RepID=UPI00345463E3